MARRLQRIDPPVLAAPPRLSLMAAAVRPDVLPEGWIEGFVWRPETAEADLTVEGYWWEACTIGDAGDPPSHDKPTGERPATVEVVPVQVVEGDTCSPVGWTQDNFVARVRRAITATTPAKVGREFWTGAVAQLADLPNNYLAKSPDQLNGGSATPLQYALIDLQDYLADTITGRGMIHCTPGTLSLWLSAGMVRREGNVWLDVRDNLVIADDGYDGSGPEDTGEREVWAYATGMVAVLEEPNPIILPGTYADALDRSTNTVTWRAEKVVAATWDGIAHAAVLVDLCETCCPAI